MAPARLAQADEQHLHQAALDGGGEVGVRLDAVADQDVVGLHGEAIEVQRHALGSVADDDGFRAGADGAAHGRLGDAVGFQHAALAFGGAAAVAAHGGDQEGPRTEAAEVLDGRAEDGDDVGDAAAAGGDGHALAGPQRPLQLEAGQFGVDRRGDIRDAGSLEGLADAEDLREFGHQRQCSGAGFPVIIGHGNKERKALPTDTVAGTS